MNRLGVGLMVKNEALIIERCLESILNLKPDLVVITDTGSIDDTVVKAGVFLQNNQINYRIYSEKFVDFASNRNLVLDRAAENAIDYLLMIDADEEMQYSPDFNAENFKASLTHDIYDIKMGFGTVGYHLPRLTKNTAKSRYEAVIHEYLNNVGESKGVQCSIAINQKNDSHRRVNHNKFKNDIEIMSKAFEQPETSANLKTRYAFYLAQTYYAIEEYGQAIKFYTLRTTLGGWEEEVFYSYYQMGNIYNTINPHNLEPIIRSYLLAYQACPTRIESLAALKKVFDKNNLNFLSDMLLPTLRSIKHPGLGLFLEDYLYYAWPK